MRATRRLRLGAAVGTAAAWALALTGCPGDGGGGGEDDCADSTPVAATQCNDVFDCDPSVELAFATGAEDFAVMEEGSTQDIWEGAQGGYHFFAAAQMTGLCPIVFLTFSIQIDRGGGERQTIQEIERHVQSVRCSSQPDLFPDGCTDDPTLQRWWPMQLVIPCDYHPDDPNAGELDCVDPPIEHIEDLDVILKVAVRDHNGDDDPAAAREATAERRITPSCCM